jgi:hypothetical protein
LKQKPENAESKEAAEPPSVKFPGPRMRQEISRDLKLDRSQLQELWLTVRHTIEDIEESRPNREARKPRVDQLKRMEKAFERFRYELERNSRSMSDFLPHDMLEFIGRSFTFAAMAEALGKDFPLMDRDEIMRKIGQKTPLATFAAVRHHYTYAHETLGLKHGPTLLTYFITSLHKFLKDWVDLDRQNQGGRPTNPIRYVLIWRLAEAAPKIIGEPATSALKGKFIELCNKVLPACGVPADGLEKVLPKVLGDLQACEPKTVAGGEPAGEESAERELVPEHAAHEQAREPILGEPAAEKAPAQEAAAEAVPVEKAADPPSGVELATEGSAAEKPSAEEPAGKAASGS